jgi:transposase
MQKKFAHFVGIDISKEYFDATLIWQGNKNQMISQRFENNEKGIKTFLRWLRQNKAALAEILFCMEHTGIYGKPLMRCLIAENANLWMEMSFQIIRSMGIQRGKNDKIDACRIALYAYKHAEDAKLYQPPRIVVEQLRLLLMQRDKLVQTKMQLLQTVQEMDRFDPHLAAKAKSNIKRTLRSMEKDIEAIDLQMNELVASDSQLKKWASLCQSVPGVGRITSLYLICFTNEFSRFNNSRQLACYCGVVPFEYTSGKSIRGKPRVHHMANKTLKRLLHLGALASSVYYDEFRLYKERKLQEGKSKMLILNNIRNKMIHRVCAVVQRQTPYEKNFVPGLV